MWHQNGPVRPIAKRRLSLADRQRAQTRRWPQLAAVLLTCLTGAALAEPVPEGGPLSTGFGYDANGNLTTVNLPKGPRVPDARQQRHEYDGLGRLKNSTLAAPQPGAGVQCGFHPPLAEASHHLERQAGTHQ